MRLVKFDVDREECSMPMTPRKSECRSNEPVRVSTIDQQQFHVHLEPTKSKYKGTTIYKDGFGQRVVFV